MTGAITGMVCLVGDPDIPAGSRISANSSTQSCDVTTVTADLDNLDNKAENSGLNPYFGDVFDENGNYVNTSNGGVYPRIIIKTEIGKFILITDWEINTESKLEGLNKICLKYFDDLHLDRSKLYHGKFSFQVGGLAAFNFHPNSYVENTDESDWWAIVDKKMLVIYITQFGQIGTLPSYISNIKSIIYHEYLHLAGFDSHKDKTIEGIEKHIKVYDQQINLTGYILCTVRYRVEIIQANLRNLIHRLKKDFNNSSKYNYWINHFKKQGYDFSR
ncbi:MAG: hypothetical protein IPP05_10555 [Cytophagaceae bacterium]|nr:hypothetical protein [Cytophagaceae bacterium]